MANFLFWNVNGRPALEQIVALAREHGIDVLVLAENRISEVRLLESLNSDGPGRFSLPYNPSRRVTILTRFPPGRVRAVSDPAGASVHELSPPIGVSILMIAVHLPSKLYRSESEQTLFCTDFARTIEREETKLGHSRTVVFGDLNMNPFEPGVVGAGALHAVMSTRVAMRGSRQVDGTEYPFLYNPMWGLLGEASAGPPGTYYYDRGGRINYYWHTFDQVLLRPDVLPLFDPGNLEVLTRAGEQSLLKDDGTLDPQVSDHLPIRFRVDIERGERR